MNHQSSLKFDTPEEIVENDKQTLRRNYYEPPPNAIFFIQIKMAPQTKILSFNSDFFSEQEIQDINR